jgi:ASC-1-like (ASCH) protein
MPNHHLVILKKPYLERILYGSKTIESRFTKTKRPYFGRVLPGDTLFLKESSGPVCGRATVASVKNFENLTPKRVAKIKQQCNHDIGGDDEYWRSKAGCKFGVLVWLRGVEPIKPVRIGKKDWRGWVLLTERQDFGLLNRQSLERTAVRRISQ